MMNYDDSGMSRREIRRANRAKNQTNRKVAREQRGIQKDADLLFSQYNSGISEDELFPSLAGPITPAEKVAQNMINAQKADIERQNLLKRTTLLNNATMEQLNNMGEGYDTVPSPYKRGGQMRDTLLNKLRFK